MIQVEKPIALSNYPEDELWTSELKESRLPKSSSKDSQSQQEVNDDSIKTFFPYMITYYQCTEFDFHFQHQQYWRKVDKIIMHQSFKGEALSWKGNNDITICWRIYQRVLEKG